MGAELVIFGIAAIVAILFLILDHFFPTEFDE